jgi:hypothetical protein
MFVDENLEEHLKTSPSISGGAAVIAEWNMNTSDQILQIGNYRYRPSDPESPYKNITTSFNLDDTENAYTNATDSDITIDGGYNQEEDGPILFVSKRQKNNLLFSLEDCLGKFRPRSGINKLLFGSGKYTHFPNMDMAKRPRYYMADKTDLFKYWTSYREESAEPRGIANKKITSSGKNYIDDAAPYVVYKDLVPANRIVIKMQTNVGSENFGVFTNVNESFLDPFFGYENQTTPLDWKVQYLSNNNDWIDAISFSSGSKRSDGSNIIKSDGYVELGYGLIIPEEYKAGFKLQNKTYPSQTLLPSPTLLDEGAAFFIKTSDFDKGRYAVVIDTIDGKKYAYFNASYGWYLDEEEFTSTTNYVTVLSNPENPQNNVAYKESTGKVEYREFQYIKGIRIVVDTMNKFESTFDLIEMSPRLKVDISDRVRSVSISKSASDIGVSGLPVGQLLASTGSLELFDYDKSFFSSNDSSILSKFLSQNIQFKFYEIVYNVEGFDYYIPVKTMYSEGFPELSNKDRGASLNIRDLFFYMESTTAPQLFLQNASLSSAVCTLLDYIGFSNYVFLRNPGESELIIPYFYVAPDKTIAEVLSDLAMSAQAAMFFDEYNNLIVMSKGYMMPSEDERPTSATLYGSPDSRQNEVYSNETTSVELANIIDVASQDTSVFNDGSINYVSSYIQRSYSSLKQANLIDRDKNWVYKPSLLWEVSPSERTKSINEELNQMSDYVLTAMTLNSTLTKDIPYVTGGQVKNNIIDFGDAVYWIGRYNGYFYAGGEVIKYDAVEYSIPGLSDEDAVLSDADGYNVWISSVQEYQKYFAKIPFNGKMYPTGRVRIFTELEYTTYGDTTKISGIRQHGRGQFGTIPVDHFAGVNPYWTTDPTTLRGVNLENKYLFSDKLNIELSGAYSEKIDRGDVSFFSSAPEIDCKIISNRVSSIEHGLSNGDKIYFNSDGDLPDPVTDNKIYFVTKLNEDEFSIASTPTGDPITSSLLSQSGRQTWTPVITPASKAFATTITIEAEEDTVFSGPAASLKSGDKVYLTTTGSLPTGLAPYRVYTITSIDEEDNTFKLEYFLGEPIQATGSQSGTHTVNVIRFPATVGCPQHRLLPGDEFIINFKEVDEEIDVSSWEFPDPLTEGELLTVSKTGITNDTIIIEDSDGNWVYLDTDSTGEFVLKAVILENLLSKLIVVPNTENILVGMVVKSISGTGAFETNTKVLSVQTDRKRILLDQPVKEKLFYNYINPATGGPTTNIIRISDTPVTEPGIAGKTNGEERSTTRTGLVKNSLSNSYIEDGQINSQQFSTQSGTVQSSALVMHGATSLSNATDPSLLSYVYKKLDNKFVHFGTRMRIVGQFNNSEIRGQSPVGSGVYYTASPKSSDQTATISGASGGISVLVDPETNNGYYLELAALSESNLSKYAKNTIHDVIFYKVQKNSEPGSVNSTKAIPIKLWGGLVGINIDSGLFADQSRLTSSQDPSIYDVSIEYKEVGSSLMFQIFINGDIVATVYDNTPMPNYKANNNVALFIRGGSRVMFENLYALACNYAENTVSSIGTLNESVFGAGGDLEASTAFAKYSIPGMIQSTYLAGVSVNGAPSYNIYYEEFGTIFREAAYFDVRYDKAYPALTAKIAPTFNKNKGFIISGFSAGAYGAEFLIFNITDTILSLDSTSGNYLRILGVALTQQSSNELTVDEYYSKKSNLSDPQFKGDSIIYSPVKVKQEYQDIKFSRITNGKKEFSLTVPYIQSQDSANEMMGWLTSKIMKPRKSIGVKIFAMPILQLGDIVNIDYVDKNQSTEIADKNDRFIVYSIDYSRTADSGPEMIVYLSEVK